MFVKMDMVTFLVTIVKKSKKISNMVVNSDGYAADFFMVNI